MATKTEDERYAEYNMTPEERGQINARIRAKLANSRPEGWWESFRVTREDAKYGLLWSEDDLTKADEKMAANKAARQARDARMRAAERLRDETDRVVREMKAADEAKLRAKAEKVARERLGM